jgi:hypothetical protein
VANGDGRSRFAGWRSQMRVRQKVHGETDKMKLITAMLRALHPDTNGGDHSRTEEFQAAIREHRIHNQVCACGCGKLVDPARMRLNPKTKLAGQFCKGRYVGNLRRKPRKLAVAMGLLCAFLSISCSSLKQMAPNTWNITAPVDQYGRGQGVWFGIGGALPWGKQ